MSTISEKTTIAELGAIVSEALRKVGIDAFLSGGAVVSIYTNNRYESFDLDFVSLADRSKIKKVMEDLGFNQDRSRLFIHPKSKFFVEFPGSAIRVGESLITEFNQIKLKSGTLKLLTPTDCVKDRLAAFYHWNDRQGLDQAVWVTLAQPVDLKDVKPWSKIEGALQKYEEFLKALKAASITKRK
ncbi:MAG TPA: hypothetical protein DCS07_08030 [Bdellovibrionales bacterium]|nr:MAG: hypothetical protein A2Z97_08590 [Bdellovibrionales bacterium GWB1_52_6]OFZ02414.1 MAG: hypothetical protein A2X97_12755 [Bdellovibrionales bacterium GWA1_52_35]OFZ34345.1 MAG: hypothetical protein A2070_02990 [Bdellovibrionales bacterium GWC1_52_8]HAR42564.1 hypothetical protein [Bdellovibrionales bacterium]HCM41557.1 hypothetical protein [Bdellovibrionales bacterium]